MKRILAIFPFIAILCLATATAQTVNYSYDAAGRLTRADYGDAGAIAYTYDPAGNLLQREVTRGAAGAFATISAASFAVNQALAPELIVSGFGADLASGVLAPTSTPLPTELLGTSVAVRDSAGTTRLASLFFVSAGQINYLIPAGTALGEATITVTSGTGSVSVGTVQIERVAPALFTANQQGTGVAAAFFLRIAADGTRTQEIIFDGNLAPVSISLGPEGEQVFLLLFGTGVRGFENPVTVTVGEEAVGVLGAVPAPGFVGLDQVNIGPLPRTLIGRGEVEIIVTADGKDANTVTVAVQ